MTATLEPGQVLAFVLMNLVVILAVARMVGNLFVRIQQPRVVGEIVAGVLLGPTVLGFTLARPPDFLKCAPTGAGGTGVADPTLTACLFPAQSQSVLAVVGSLALVFFMFLVGVDLDTESLRGRFRGIATLSVGVVAIPVAASFAISGLLFNDLWVFGFGTDTEPSRLAFTLMVAAMLSVTAFPVMARILQEKGMDASPMGVVGIASAAVVTVLMFLVVAVASGAASGEPGSSQVIRLAGTAGFVGVMLGVVRPALARWWGPRIQERGTLGAGDLAAAVMLMFTAALVADRIGINVIPGAFLAGVVLPARKVMARELNAHLGQLTVVILLPVFLAVSGLRTDLTTLGVAHIGGVVLVLVVAVASKWGGGAVAGRLGGLSWAEGNLLGILMNCRGLLVLVVGLIGVNEGVLSTPMQAAGVLMAIVTTAMTGPLFDRFAPAVTAPTQGETR